MWENYNLRPPKRRRRVCLLDRLRLWQIIGVSLIVIDLVLLGIYIYKNVG